MAAYRRVYDSRHLQADCQEPGSSPEPYAEQSSMGYFYLFTSKGRGQEKRGGEGMGGSEFIYLPWEEKKEKSARMENI